MSLEDDFASIEIVGAAKASCPMKYNEQLLADSHRYMAGILGRTDIPHKTKEFMSYVGAYFISVEPAAAGARMQQKIRCREVEKGFFEDVLALKGIGALANKVQERIVSPEKLKSFFPELDEIENHELKTSLINFPYSHIFAAEHGYKPIIAALFKDMPDEMIVQAGKLNKNQVVLSTMHLVETIQGKGLPLDLIEGINSEIKRINRLYDKADEKCSNYISKNRKNKKSMLSQEDIAKILTSNYSGSNLDEYNPISNYWKKKYGLKI